MPDWMLAPEESEEDRFWVPGPMDADRVQERFGQLFAADAVALLKFGDGSEWKGPWSEVCQRGIAAGERLRLPGIPVAAGPLLAVMDRLLGENGCPWDRSQTPLSLLRYLLDESYEAAEALVSGDLAGLVDELGDVLLQVVFQSALLPEGNFHQVAIQQAHKLIRRHPHVFHQPEAEPTSYAEVASNWENIKRLEAPRTHRGDWIYPALVQARRATKRGVIPKSAHFRAVCEWLEVYCNQDLEKIEEILGDAAWAVAATGSAFQNDVEWALWKRLALVDKMAPNE